MLYTLQLHFMELLWHCKLAVAIFFFSIFNCLPRFGHLLCWTLLSNLDTQIHVKENVSLQIILLLEYAMPTLLLCPHKKIQQILSWLYFSNMHTWCCPFHLQTQVLVRLCLEIKNVTMYVHFSEAFCMKNINSKKVFSFSDSAVNSDGCDKNMNWAYVGVYVNTDTKVCGYLYEYAPTPQVASMINLC